MFYLTEVLLYMVEDFTEPIYFFIFQVHTIVWQQEKKKQSANSKGTFSVLKYVTLFSTAKLVAKVYKN